MKKKSAFVLLTVFGFAVLLGGCSDKGKSSSVAGTSGTTAAGPWDARYPETVTVTIGRVNTQNLGLPSGDSIEDNLFLDYIYDRLNIKVEYAWLVDEASLAQKITLALATGDMPDIMMVPNQVLLAQLAESGLLADLDVAYVQGMSPYVQDMFDSYGDKKFETCVFDGKLQAISNLIPGYSHAVTWLRKDWLDKLGLAEPKTLDDLKAVIKAFVERDPDGNGRNDTIGLLADRRVGGIYNTNHVMDPILGLYDSYPRQWLKDANGKVYYGTTAPETKTALGVLREWYAEGLIDRQFAVVDEGSMNEPIAAGKCGSIFGPWWAGFWPLRDSVNNDPNADWRPYLTPVDANGNLKTYQQNIHTGWAVVKKGYAHPEVLFKLLSLKHEQMMPQSQIPPAYHDPYFEAGIDNVGWDAMPIALQFSEQDYLPREYEGLKEALATKNPGNLSSIMMPPYEGMLKYLEGDKNYWDWYITRADGYEIAGSDKTKVAPNCVFFSMTETMQALWPSLERLENQAMLEIITGERSLDYFDEFVAQWNRLGGQAMCEEVTELIKAK